MKIALLPGRSCSQRLCSDCRPNAHCSGAQSDSVLRDRTLHGKSAWFTRSFFKPALIATIATSAAASGGISKEGDWNKLSTSLVDSATLPFVFLLAPQVFKNAQNLVAGNSAALAALSWVGFSMALAGNAMLLTYFVGQRERSAIIIQALGVGSNFVLLVQLFAAGYMPRNAIIAVAAAVLATSVINTAKLNGTLDTLPSGKTLWSLWGELLGLAGLVLLPQAVWETMSSGTSILPGAAAAACAACLFLAKRKGWLGPQLQQLSSNLLGWTATMLFMFQPLAQLVRNFQSPASLVGVSLLTILLATAGNSLMVPRAVCTNDTIWTVGSLWGSLFGWMQILSLFLARTLTGRVHIQPPVFYGVTALMVAYFSFVFLSNAQYQAQQKKSPL